jgi:hypothetical protein
LAGRWQSGWNSLAPRHQLNDDHGHCRSRVAILAGQLEQATDELKRSIRDLDVVERFADATFCAARAVPSWRVLRNSGRASWLMR